MNAARLHDTNTHSANTMFRPLNLLLLFALLVMTTHARKYTTTVDGEEVVATVFTDADDDVITSVMFVSLHD